MKIQEKVLLNKYTTFKIGGPADYFAEAKTTEDVLAAVAWAQKNNLPIMVLGGGSNILMSDQGWRGLVIKLNLNRLEIIGDRIIVGAGVTVSYLLNQALNHKLVGLEFMAGIPGSVGGAIRGNAGTYGQAIGDVLENIIYLSDHYNVHEMDPRDAHFSYRHSIFKENKSVVLEAVIKLGSGDVAAARELVNQRLKYRQETQPQGASAGCIFKNLTFDQVDVEKLKKQGLDIDQFIPKTKIPASYLIDQAGLKGKKIGGAEVSTKHANYIINSGQATAEDVVTLISLIKQQVRDQFGVQLHEEIKLML